MVCVIVPLRLPVDGLEEGEGLLPLLGQIQADQHAGVVFSQQLGLGVGQLVIEVVQIRLVLLVQIHIALLHLVVGKEEHIHQGNGIVVDAAHDPAVLLPLRRVGGVHQAHQLVVQISGLGKLPGRQGVGEHVAVHDLHVGQSHGVVHLVIALQPVQQSLLTGIVAFRHDQRHDILGAEGLVDLLLGDLGLVLPGGLDLAVAVDIGTLVGQQKARRDGRRKQGHPHIAQLQGKPAPAVDPGNKAAVLRSGHGLGKEHQQARHQGKDRKHAEQNGLDEHDAHVKADAELHEHHGGQAGDGGEAAGGDGGNGGADCRDAGLPVPGIFPLLQKAVEHDDGVVDGQGQLQHHGHRVGHEGDLSEDKIGAQVQHRRRDKGEQQHRDLRVGAGGQQQHQHNDHRRHRQNDPHLTGQGVCLGAAHGAVDVAVIGREQLPDGGQGGKADLVVLLPVKGHGDQGVRPLEILRDVLRRLRFAVLLRVRADIAASKGS